MENRSEARRRFYSMYYTVKYKEQQCSIYHRIYYNRNLWYSATTVLASIFCSLFWSIFQSLSALWACLIAASQLAQAAKDLLPWSQRLTALEYFLPDVRSLLLDIEDTWNRIDFNDEQWDTNAINEKRSQYDHAYGELEAKYIGLFDFPWSKAINEEATTETNIFFNNRYHSPTEGGEQQCEMISG